MRDLKYPVLTLLILLILGQPLRSEDIDQFLGRRYELRNSTNFGALLKALDIGFFERLKLAFAIPVDSLSKLGDKYVYKSESVIYNIHETFAPGVPFPFTTVDGRYVTSTITIDGDAMTEVQVEKSGRTTIIDRIFSEYTLAIEVRVGRVVATRYHELLMDDKDAIKPTEQKSKNKTSNQQQEKAEKQKEQTHTKPEKTEQKEEQTHTKQEKAEKQKEQLPTKPEKAEQKEEQTHTMQEKAEKQKDQTPTKPEQKEEQTHKKQEKAEKQPTKREKTEQREEETQTMPEKAEQQKEQAHIQEEQAHIQEEQIHIQQEQLYTQQDQIEEED